MRFMLTYNGQRHYPNYAQVMVRTEQLEQIPGLIDEIESYMHDEYPQVDAQIKRIMFGPSNNSSIEARFIGPDPDVLRTWQPRRNRRLSLTQWPMVQGMTGRIVAR